MLVVQRKILQIVNIPSKAMQCKTIDLISAHKFLQTTAEDIGQLRRGFDAVLNEASTIAFTWGLPRQFSSQQCYAGPMRVLRGLLVREPYRFGRGGCSGLTWANRTGLIWLSILSRNQKLKHANKLTFLIIFKKEFFA